MFPESDEPGNHSTHSYFNDTEEEEEGNVELENAPLCYSGQIENRKLHLRFHPPELTTGQLIRDSDSESTQVIYRWIPEPKNIRREVIYVCDKALGIASVSLIIFGIVLLMCAIALFQNQ